MKKQIAIENILAGMKTILVTGATGNVGAAVLKYLHQIKGNYRVLAGVRHLKTTDHSPQEYNNSAVYFDFLDIKSISDALEQTDILFLLRPPQISDVKKVFNPLISMVKEKKVKHIVFLSVQGADNNSFIPHHKIEKLISESGISYTFLRPAYFMQNFTTTLKKDLVQNDTIFLPAGFAKFTLIDVEDVGAVAAEVLTNPDLHINKAYDLTSGEQLDFAEMATMLSQILGRKITYKSPGLLRFFLKKRGEGIPTVFILVMIMLHYLPRFKSAPSVSQWVHEITGIAPCSFPDFIKSNRSLLLPDQ